MSYLVIRMLALLRLAWNVKVPSKQARWRENEGPDVKNGPRAVRRIAPGLLRGGPCIMAKNSSVVVLYRPFLMLGGIVLVAATLHWAQQILIPLTLAVLLTFILSPLVALLQRRGLPRVPAALLVVLLALLVVAGVGSGLTFQARRLAGELPQYKDNIARKVAGVRGLGESRLLRNVRDTFHAVMGSTKSEETPPQEVPPQSAQSQAGAPETTRAREVQSEMAAEPPPLRVRLEPSTFPDFQQVFGPAAESLALAGLVIVLVTFMLIQRQDLRNRLMRLVPQGRLLLTTRAVAEAADRLSRFLLMQLAVNAGYGLVLGTGLALIGLPYAAGVGHLVSAFLQAPALRRHHAVDGPGHTLRRGGLPGLDATTADPWPVCRRGTDRRQRRRATAVRPQYGRLPAGAVDCACFLDLAVGTDRIGAVDAADGVPDGAGPPRTRPGIPGRSARGRAGPGPTEINFYQRLLAGDQDEATDLVVQFVSTHPPDTVYDRMLLPALGLTRVDRASDELAPETERFICRATRDILDYLAATIQAGSDRRCENQLQKALEQPAGVGAVVFGCPARDEVDELSLHMLAQLLEPSACRFKVLPAGTDAAAVAARAQRERPVVLCIAALPPGGLAQALYLSKRLRARFPGLKLLVGLWGAKEKRDGLAERLLSSGADQVAGTLAEARDHIVALLGELTPLAETTAPSGGCRGTGRPTSRPYRRTYLRRLARTRAAWPEVRMQPLSYQPRLIRPLRTYRPSRTHSEELKMGVCAG